MIGASAMGPLSVVTSTANGALADLRASTLNVNCSAARQLFGSTPAPVAVTFEASTSACTGTVNGLPILV